MSGITNSGFGYNSSSEVPIDYPIQHVDDIREIVVHQENVTPRVLYETRQEKPRGEYLYLICRGDYPHEYVGDYESTYEETTAGVTHTRFLLNPEKALRHIFSFGEQHGVDEDELIGELCGEHWFDSTFSTIVGEDPETRLANGIKHFAQTVTGAEREYFKRILSLGNEREVGNDVEPDYDNIDAQCCYRVAYELAQRHKELDYVEGFGINKYGANPRFHAWNELNGKVLDYTWGWTGPVPEEDTVYYGVKIDMDDVREAKRRRGYCARVLIEDYNTIISRTMGGEDER